MTTPTDTNNTANTVSKVEGVVVDTGETAIETAIEAYVPVLATPGLKQLWEMAFEWLINKFKAFLQFASIKGVIDLQVNKEAGAVTDATTALKTADATGDANAIAKAKQDAADAIQNLMHSDGSAKPQ